MATAVSKADFTVLRSINTPDYPLVDWVINSPNLDTLVGVTGTDDDPEVAKRYWIVDPPTSQNLREMTQPEKDAADADLAEISKAQAKKIPKLTDQTKNFLDSRYKPSVQESFSQLRSTVSGAQETLLNSYYAWNRTLYDALNVAVTSVNAATDVLTVEAVTIDYAPFVVSDPLVTVEAILNAAPGVASGALTVFDPSVSTTTSSNFQTKVQLLNQTLEAGTYRFTLSYGWNLDTTSSSFESIVREDSGGGFVQVYEPHLQEPQDSSGSWGVTGSDQRNYVTRVFDRVLTAGTYSWDFQFRSVVAGIEASVWEILFYVTKV